MKMAAAAYFNICDLVDAPARNTRVKRFQSQQELEEYTLNRRKFFPLESALAGGVLKFLLRRRHFLHPPRKKPKQPPSHLAKAAASSVFCRQGLADLCMIQNSEAE